MSAGRPVAAQDACFRVLLTDGLIVRIKRIEQDADGNLNVRAPGGQVYAADQIAEIIRET